jgi:hypothetical protein
MHEMRNELVCPYCNTRFEGADNVPENPSRHGEMANCTKCKMVIMVTFLPGPAIHKVTPGMFENWLKLRHAENN